MNKKKEEKEENSLNWYLFQKQMVNSNFLEYLYYVFYFVSLKIFFFLGMFQTKNKRSSLLSKEQQYLETMKSKFLKTYTNKDKSFNIDNVFYDRPKFKTLIASNNPLEQMWKRRILIEYTSQGNIIMFYDVYKEGFSYYSDQFVPYSLLNAVAMKYVMIYKCFDFFIDNSITLSDSPFLTFIKNEETNEIDKKKIYLTNILNHQDPLQQDNNNTNKMKTTTNNPFVKFKNYNTNLEIQTKKPNTSFQQQKQREEQQIQQFYKNKFIYLGKIQNYSFIQKIKKQVLYKHPDMYFDEFKKDILKKPYPPLFEDRDFNNVLLSDVNYQSLKKKMMENIKKNQNIPPPLSSTLENFQFEVNKRNL